MKRVEVRGKVKSIEQFTTALPSGKQLAGVGVVLGYYAGYDRQSQSAVYRDVKVKLFGKMAEDAVTKLASDDYFTVWGREEVEGEMVFIQAKDCDFPYKPQQQGTAQGGTAW